MDAISKKISDLNLDPSNARKHDKKNLAAIKGSLSKFGQQKPIVISKDNVIIAGNGTYMAAKELGWDNIDCVVTELSGTEAIAFALADNKTAELAEWDDEVLKKTIDALLKEEFDIGDIGFDIGDFPGMEKKSGNTEDDEVPEVPQNIHNVKLGDIWQLGNHRLMCGDSTVKENVEKLMDGKKANLWVTDPPYGVNIKQVSIDRYEKTGRGNTQSRKKEIENDISSKSDWKDILRDVFTNAHHACTDKASHYVFTCQGSDKMMMMMMMQEAGWNFRHEILWIKNRFILGRSDYHYQHEPCLYGWKENGTHEWFGGRDKSSTLQYDVSKNDLHPTMKPVGLIEELILNSSKKNGIVLDTFCGSGSTLIACEKTNRICYGMELDPHYCSVIIERWQNFTGKKANLLSANN